MRVTPSVEQAAVWGGGMFYGEEMFTIMPGTVKASLGENSVCKMGSSHRSLSQILGPSFRKSGLGFREYPSGFRNLWSRGKVKL